MTNDSYSSRINSFEALEKKSAANESFGAKLLLREVRETPILQIFDNDKLDIFEAVAADVFCKIFKQ